MAQRLGLDILADANNAPPKAGPVLSGLGQTALTSMIFVLKLPLQSLKVDDCRLKVLRLLQVEKKNASSVSVND